MLNNQVPLRNWKTRYIRPSNRKITRLKRAKKFRNIITLRPKENKNRLAVVRPAIVRSKLEGKMRNPEVLGNVYKRSESSKRMSL